jgi:hypothetical protein
MTMFKRFFLLILIVFLAGCGSNRHNMPPPPVDQYPIESSEQYRRVPSFTQVDVRGRINIHLHTGYKKHQVILKGDPRDLAQTQTGVQGTTLFLIVAEGYPRYGAISADIKGQFLNRVSYKGTGLVYGHQLRTSYLELYLANYGRTSLGGTIGLQKLGIVGNGLTRITGITSHDVEIRLKGNPKVQLRGQVSLSKLNVDGDGWLSLYWVKSPSLIIRAKNSTKIQLAGYVRRLDVELWGSANFKGRYLRAERSFVKTHDTSVAEISAVNHQSNLASDASDIYYYNLPGTRADFMANNGSVLDLRDWGQYDIEEFTRYNKQFP